MARKKIKSGAVKTVKKNGKTMHYVARRKDGKIHWYASDAEGNRLFKGGKKVKKIKKAQAKEEKTKAPTKKRKTVKKRGSTRRKSEPKICLTLSQFIKIFKG